MVLLAWLTRSPIACVVHVTNNGVNGNVVAGGAVNLFGTVTSGEDRTATLGENFKQLTDLLGEGESALAYNVLKPTQKLRLAIPSA